MKYNKFQIKQIWNMVKISMKRSDIEKVLKLNENDFIKAFKKHKLGKMIDDDSLKELYYYARKDLENNAEKLVK